MSRRLAHALPWIVAAIPVMVALLLASAAEFASAGAILNLLGRLTGIAALSLLLVSAALACRVPGFDLPFGGLTKLWATHHRLGAAALFMVLAHPVLLSLSAATASLDAAALTLVPAGADWAMWSGWIALLAMVVFLAPSFAFFGEPEYQRWRWLHRLSALAVLGALVHTFLLARSLPSALSVGIWGVLAAAALAAVAWRFVFSRRAGRLRYTVAEVARPANNIVELSLRPFEHSLKFSAGQFVYLAPYDRQLAAGYAEEHPYTLSSAPGERALRIAIKDLGDASRAIQSIAPGSEVRIEGPYGDFFPRHDSAEPELWIAGGIGITPFLGRLRHLAATQQSLDARLVYCVQDQARAHFSEELEALAAQVPGFDLTQHFFFREGPLSAEFLATHCPDFVSRRAYICGPDPLLERARSILLRAGVARDQIVTEEFTLL
ncbi:MAG: ferric reductase-like transmembrane domain-containing protein [Gammaproteobacteria bacterium]|nr:ferric reductase-like transmembrane domain-containing protein [Gammaproteobacteria bacterium]